MLAACLTVYLTFPACKSQGRTPEQRYTLKGEIVALDAGRHKITIAHEDIPGLMEAMTMAFDVKENQSLNALSAGAKVEATLIVVDGDYWLENGTLSK